MTPFKFARTRYVYDSYQDFWAMVDIAKLPTCYVDEIDPGADCVYVTTPMTGELKSRQLFDRKCKIVWWNLERPDGEFAPDYLGVLRDAYKYVDDIWVSDLSYQALAPDSTRFVVMGSRKELAVEPVGTAQIYDIAHYSYVNGRRNHIYGQLAQRGLRLAPNGWGGERANGLLNSNVFLNVHQTDALIGEPLRFAVAAAYKTFLVSETLVAPYPLIPSFDYVEASYGRIAEFAAAQATAWTYPVKHMLGQSLYARLCVEYEFPKDALMHLAGL